MNQEYPMSRYWKAGVLGALLMFGAARVPAHHSVWAEFDNGSPVEMRGRFIEMDWINPHSWVHFEVTGEDGSKVTWAAETPPPNQLIRQGWRRSDIQPDDEIVVRGYAARNGTQRIWARDVAIVVQNGVVLDEPKTVLALLDPNPDGIAEGVLPGQRQAIE
jgi:hypothetical protein